MNLPEEDFLNSLITDTKKQTCLFNALGWQTAHFRPAMVAEDSKGKKQYRTPCQGDAKGWPDIFAAKILPVAKGVLVEVRFLWAECKTDDGRLTTEQDQWLNLLSQCHKEVYLFRPKYMDEIIEILSLGHVPNSIELARWECTWKK